VVLDLGCGTGAIALALAPRAKRVVGRDASGWMAERAREQAAERGFEISAKSRSIRLAPGSVGLAASSSARDARFRAPEYDGPVEVVVSIFAMHHLPDAEKRETIAMIAVIATLEPRRFVLGDVLLFGKPDPDEPFYSSAVDDPTTVGTLVEAFTAAGFAVIYAWRHQQVGERLDRRRSELTSTSARRECVVEARLEL
jgi:SAM-dependent methyltransferase